MRKCKRRQFFRLYALIYPASVRKRRFIQFESSARAGCIVSQRANRRKLLRNNTRIISMIELTESVSYNDEHVEMR